MAQYATLKAAIDAVIKANGQREITGTVLNQTLNAMVNSLGANYQLAGVATPSTNPGTPDQNVFYLAFEAGTYTNFNATVLSAGISILMWNGSWSSQTFYTIDATPTASSNNLVSSGAVFDAIKTDGSAYDVSAHFPTAGPNNDGKFTLEYILSNANTLIPAAWRKGGMSIRFVQSSDNKYVQYRLMSDTFNTTVANWQGVDDEPTAGSENLVKSGGVAEVIGEEPATHTYTSSDFVGFYAIGGRVYNSNSNYNAIIIPLLKGNTYTLPNVGLVRVLFDHYPIVGETYDTNNHIEGGDYTADGTFKYIVISLEVASFTSLNIASTGCQIKKDIKDLQDSVSANTGAIIVAQQDIDNLEDDEDSIKRSLYKFTKSYAVTANTPFDSKSNPVVVPVANGEVFYVRVVTSQNNDNNLVAIGGHYGSNNFAIISLVAQNAIIKFTSTRDLKDIYIHSFTPIANDTITLEVYIGENNQAFVNNKYYESVNGIKGLLHVLSTGRVVQNKEILFTSKDVEVGKKVYYSLSFNDYSLHTSYLMIGVYDANNTILGSYGKTTSTATTENTFSGEFVIPQDFSYALISTDALQNTQLTAAKINYIYTEDYLGKKTEVDVISESPEVIYAETDKNDRVLREVSLDAEKHYQQQIFKNDIVLEKPSYEGLMTSIRKLGVPQVDSIVIGTPEVVMSTADSSATGWDSFHFGYAQVIKIREDLYYLYYNGYGPDGYMIDSPANQTKSMLFAYSTDGVHWTKGFPSGVTPPWGNDAPYSIKFIDNIGRNRYLPADCFFLVNDAEYPFRCITTEGDTLMFKSADGFTFTEVCIIEQNQQRDTQPGAILRGDVIKLYNRGWSGGYWMGETHGYGTRTIIVEYCDINGNLICQESPMMLENYYNSAASRIDDHREVLFPTYYRDETVPVKIDCYIVDGTYLQQIDFASESSSMLGAINGISFKWSLAQSGLVAIGGKLYLYYSGATCSHNQIPDTSIPRTCELRRVEVRFNCSKLKYKQ